MVPHLMIVSLKGAIVRGRGHSTAVPASGH
jgi:hypothetical protein